MDVNRQKGNDNRENSSSSAFPMSGQVEIQFLMSGIVEIQFPMSGLVEIQVECEI